MLPVEETKRAESIRLKLSEPDGWILLVSRQNGYKKLVYEVDEFGQW